jgi:hypothetical protein
VKCSGWQLLSFVRIGSQLGFLCNVDCGHLYRMAIIPSLSLLNHSILIMRESTDATTSRRNGLDLNRSAGNSTSAPVGNSTNMSATPSARAGSRQKVPQEWRRAGYWGDSKALGTYKNTPSQSSTPTTSGTVTPQTPEEVSLPEMPSLKEGMGNVEDWLSAAKERADILEANGR